MAEAPTLVTLANLQNDTSATTAINGNFSAIATAFEDVLSLSGTAPNQMQSSLDMNSNQIINLPAPATTNSPLRLQDLNSFIGGGTITNIPPGGLTNQFLAKISNADYAVGWEPVSVDITAGNNIVVTGTGNTTIATTTTPVFATLGVGASPSGRIAEIKVGSTANSANELSIRGYQAALEVFNQAGTQNWYFGVNDASTVSPSPLWIGPGYSAGQGVNPYMIIAAAGNVPGVTAFSDGSATEAQMFATVPNAPVGGVVNIVSTNDDYLLSLTRISNTSLSGGSFINLNHFSGTHNPQPTLNFDASPGTESAPTALQAGQTLGVIQYTGNDGSSTNSGWYEAFDINVYATNTWSVSSHPANINFYTTPINSSTKVEVFTIDQNGFVGIGGIGPQQTFGIHDWLQIRAGTNTNLTFGSVGQTVTGAFVISSVNDGFTANEPLEIRTTKTVFSLGPIQVGASGTVGSLSLGNATSGLLTLQTATGALGSSVITIPVATDTIALLAATQTLSNKTITSTTTTGSPNAVTITTSGGNTVTLGEVLSGRPAVAVTGASTSGRFDVNGTTMEVVNTGGSITFAPSASTALTMNSNGTVQLNSASSFSTNGAVATSLGSIGPTGSHTAVQTWLTIVDSVGITRYIPCF